MNRKYDLLDYMFMCALAVIGILAAIVIAGC